MMEDEIHYVLPSPSDTPYRTPSSTRSQDYDMSPDTTPPMPSEDRSSRRRSGDSLNPALDESISPLDPRRFTPTLHASLVSEILSLRRDLENKTNDIEKLEQSLHQSQQHNEVLNTNLLGSNKEKRELKRQMQMLEGGTLSAISEISKERDIVQSETVELKRRLVTAHNRAKSHEENAERTQNLWNKEKDSWQTEKRGLETKVQIAEGRLKVVLSEISHHTQQNVRSSSPEKRVESRTSIYESPSKRMSRSRRLSTASNNSDHQGGRVSVLSFANGQTINLADELAFDEEEEDHFNADFGDQNGRISPDALPEEHVRPSSSLSIKARKVLGMPIDFGESEKNDADNRRTSTYVDTAIQFSPTTASFPAADIQHPQQKRHSRPADLMLQNGRLSGATVPSQSSPTESMDSRFAPWNHIGPIMVSSGVQTIEALPSPPLTPEKDDGILATIHESVAETVDMKTTGTQTEEVIATKPQKNWHHTATESGELQIPLINIIPPTSRPVTPETAVVLPPRTKNAGSQVDLVMLGSYESSGMQTEPIRVDRRNIIPSGQMPVIPGPSSSSQAPPPPPPPTSFKAPLSRAVQSMTRRKAPSSAAILNSQRMNVGITRQPPSNDTGVLSKDIPANIPRPVRTSSLFQDYQVEDELEEDDDKFETDNFPDDDIFSRPTAKFTLRSGKMVTQEGILEDYDESFATNAGQAVALENLRLSEDSMGADMRRSSSQDRYTPPLIPPRGQAAGKPLRRIPSVRSNNMRRAALISSGSAAHRASTSQSTNASFESTNPPPIPIPLRFSSARITKSMSEGGRSSRASSTASPTKASKLKNKHILRKSRSGPAISPHGEPRKSRSRSPPLDSRVSIVPEMPTFSMPMRHEPHSFLNEPYHPQREASAPRPSIATGPSRAASHHKTNSDAISMQQTSVVDSIAQTMVGEWMYKYVRRRKSFGMGDRSADYDTSKSMDEISASVTNSGVRHKRWVWLAPYERAVMWSSKQPTSGSALMGGKSGRKLTIKSVLDVKDDNPMPKGSILGPHFNRSILILTPQRALKFTATSQDRHFVWLTALSFLSHSPLSVNELTPLPPPPPDDQLMREPAPPSLAGSFRRRPIRDSIRIAKGSRPGQSMRSFTDGSYPIHEYERPPSRDYYDPTTDPALPPTIKRFHTRKRSNTAPKNPPTSFRGFTSRDVVPNLPGPGSYAPSTAITSTAGSDRGLYTPSLGVQSLASSRRGSEASARGGRPNLHSLFESSNDQQTVRMDAFMESAVPPVPSTTHNYLNLNLKTGPELNMNGNGYAIPSRNPARSQGPNGTYPALRSGTLKKKDWGSWGIDEGRGSISPVDSLMRAEMMAANGEESVRGSVDSRDPFRGF